MLQIDYLLAKIGVDTAENEPRKEWCVVAMDLECALGPVLRQRLEEEAVDTVPACLHAVSAGMDWSLD